MKLIQRILEKLHPELFKEKQELRDMLRNLGQKLKATRKERDEWKALSLSSKKALYDILEGVEKARSEHADRADEILYR